MLQQVEIFQGLSPEELEALAASSTSRSFPKNTVVIHENDPADSLFVIESGKVKVYCSDKNGKEFIMNTQGPGDYFGELALLDDSTRSASVRTVEKSSFCIIYKEDFNRVLSEHPNIGRQLVRNLAQRVRKLTADVKSLALQDVYGRVANVLMDLSEERGDGTLYIPEKLTQQDIADRVGASREMVARSRLWTHPGHSDTEPAGGQSCFQFVSQGHLARIAYHLTVRIGHNGVTSL
jgi:CRP/FNR family cyclic AMP-dependent transcriptional regulator